MITFSCPDCGKAIQARDDIGGTIRRCPGCNMTISVPLSPMTPVNAPPPLLVDMPTEPRKVMPPARPRPQDSDPVSVNLRNHDDSLNKSQRTALWIAAASLSMLELSLFMPWYHVPIIGSVMGIRGDGWFPFLGTLLTGAFLGASVWHRRFFSGTILTAAAWGIIACGFFSSNLLRIVVLSNAKIENNAFAELLFGVITPGIGLFVGSISSVAVFSSLNYLEYSRTSPAARRKILTSQTASQAFAGLLAGFLIAFSVSSTSSGIRAANAPESSDSVPNAEKQSRTIQIGESRRLGNIEITPVSVEYRKVSGTDGLFSKTRFESGPFMVLTVRVKNVSEGQVFKPTTIATIRDNFGNKLDDPLAYRYATIDGDEGRKELKPNMEATIIVCAEPKVAKATAYEWSLSMRGSNDDDTSAAFQDWLTHSVMPLQPAK